MRKRPRFDRSCSDGQILAQEPSSFRLGRHRGIIPRMAPESRDDRCDAAIEQHRATLIAEAIDIQRQNPGIRLVGMVIEPDAPEADAIQPFQPRTCERG